jgi:hypothetical protein
MVEAGETTYVKEFTQVVMKLSLLQLEEGEGRNHTLDECHF